MTEPGIYEAHSRELLEQTGAEMVGVLVLNGRLGSGLSVTHTSHQSRSDRDLQVAKALRMLADQIEARSQGLN